MKCTRCSAEIPSQSQYCLRCGTSISAATAPPPTGGFTPTAPPAANNKPLLIMIGVLAVALLALGGFFLSGLLNAPKKDDSSGLVRAPKKPKKSGLVEKPAESKPVTVVEKPAEGTPPPPADVVDYLAFLKQIEESRKKMERVQLSKFQAVMATLPADQLKGFMKDMDRDTPSPKAPPISAPLPTQAEIAGPWNDLSSQFQTKNPPASCQALHDAYYDFLGKTQMQILQVFDALSKAQSDQQGALSSLFAMQGDTTVDQPMHKSDQLLGEVCDKFHLRKDFDIGEGGGLSSLFH